MGFYLAWCFVVGFAGRLEKIGDELLLFSILLLVPIVVFTRDVAMGNAMLSSTNRTIVKTSIIRGKGPSGKAVASFSKGFALTISGKGEVIVSFMNCRARRISTIAKGRLAVALRSSSRTLRRMMILNCDDETHGSLANSMNSISNIGVTTMPIASTTITLRKGVTNIRMAAISNTPKTSVGVHIHKNASIARDGSPLCVISNFRISGVGSVPPASVTSVSMLGSTSVATVCKTGNNGNMIIIAAGSTGTKGVRMDFGTRLSADRLSGGLSLVGSTRFTHCRCR